MNKPDRLHKISATDPARMMCMGPFTLDLYYRKVFFSGKPVTLPPCTFDYLVTLMRHSPNPISYQELVKISQGYNLGRLEAQDLARARVYILRKSLEADPQNPQYIRAVPGYGYRIEI
jgi:DNA-binding response OmpR family regulator